MSGRIVIMAGGTGGHVFPALAVAQELLDRGWQVSWLGTKKGLESKITAVYGVEMDCLAVEGVRGKGPWEKIRAGIRLLQSCLQAYRILGMRKPHLVLGMGGFAAAPGGLMAKFLGIPVVIHEQNRVPGTTNRLLAKLAARKVLEAFPNSFDKPAAAICTGNPLRKSFTSGLEKSCWRPESGDELKILVLGGSQGAKALNEHVPTALSDFAHLSIKHQSGEMMRDDVARVYRTFGMKAEVIAFIDDMHAAYQWADMVICRAGAMTVSEVAACGLPAIFVPLPHAIDDHQTANARYLCDAGAALMLPQPALNADSLRKAVRQVSSALPAMSLSAKKMARLDATQTVADICVGEAVL